MKIRKLLTLSQFVDLCSENKTTDKNDIMYCLDTEFRLIEKYNTFLKQPLSKDMFVNELSKDLSLNKKTGEYDKEYLQAEKKVLFDGKIGWCEDMLDVFEIESVEIFYNHHTKQWHTSDEEKVLSSLHDLAEATKGELTLKNVEL